MMAMVFVAAHEPDRATRWLVRAALAVFAVAGLLTVGFVPLQQIGLLCWAMIALWGVLLTTLWFVRHESVVQIDPLWPVRTYASGHGWEPGK
jgi:hypothetical protein